MSSPYVHSKKTTTDGNAAKSKNMLTVGCEIAMSRMVDASGYSQQIESQIMASLKRLTIEDKNTITANLSEDQILQLLISFAEFDWDNSGTLDSLEYESLFTSLVSIRGVAHFFDSNDLNKDGVVDFGEFVLSIARFFAQDLADGHTPDSLADVGIRNLDALSQKAAVPFNMWLFGCNFIGALLWPLTVVALCVSSSVQKIIVLQPPSISKSGSSLLLLVSWLGAVVSLSCSIDNRDAAVLFAIRSGCVAVLAGFESLCHWDYQSRSNRRIDQMISKNNSDIDKHNATLPTKTTTRLRGRLSSTLQQEEREDQEDLEEDQESQEKQTQNQKPLNHPEWKIEEMEQTTPLPGSEIDNTELQYIQFIKNRKKSIRFVNGAPSGSRLKEAAAKVVATDKFVKTWRSIHANSDDEMWKRDSVLGKKISNLQSPKALKLVGRIEHVDHEFFASNRFKRSELFAPGSLHRHEWKYRSNLVFFPVETTRKPIHTAKDVLSQIIKVDNRRGDQAGKTGIPFMLSLIITLLRVLIFELAAFWGSSNTTPNMLYLSYTVLGVSPELPTPPLNYTARTNMTTTTTIDTTTSLGFKFAANPQYRIFAWFATTVTIVMMSTHLIFLMLCIREELCDCVSRLQLLSCCASPEQAINNDVPFLNLQIFENVVAFVSLRRYLEVVYHREMQRIVQAVLTFAGVVSGIGFCILVFDFAFTVVPSATHINEAFDSKRIRLICDVSIYAGILWSFSNVQCEITEEKDRHIQILAQERWRLEIKAARSVTNRDAKNYQIASRFDRVSSTISQSIATLKITDRSPHFFGLDAGQGLNGLICAIMSSAGAALISYAYSLDGWR